MNAKFKLVLVSAFIILVIIMMSTFSVYEGQRALVLRLGKIDVDSKGKPYEAMPGLHLKLPLISVVRYFDVRLQTLQAESASILTTEQKNVVVSYFAKWRIENLPLYYRRTDGLTENARSLLEQKINNALYAIVADRTIPQLVSGQRKDVMALLQSKANESAKEYGIDVTDVRIQKIDLPEKVRDSVYQRMRTDREKVATRFRWEGDALAKEIRSKADKDVIISLAKAKKEAQKVRAEGDSIAAKTYTHAYSKNPGFYAFYRSLQAYRDVFEKRDDTVMVLKPNSHFFKYFNSSNK